jgi:hypothetical protein
LLTELRLPCMDLNPNDSILVLPMYPRIFHSQQVPAQGYRGSRFVQVCPQQGLSN